MGIEAIADVLATLWVATWLTASVAALFVVAHVSLSSVAGVPIRRCLRELFGVKP